MKTAGGGDFSVKSVPHHQCSPKIDGYRAKFQAAGGTAHNNPAMIATMTRILQIFPFPLGRSGLLMAGDRSRSADKYRHAG